MFENLSCRYTTSIYDQPGEERGPFFPRDPRFEILEFVLLTLDFPFRLGLPGYYRLSGRFVMTPEAAILVLSAAHYRRGMTVVAFIYFFCPPPASLSSFLLRKIAPRIFLEEKVALPVTYGDYNLACVNIDSNDICILRLKLRVWYALRT